MTGSSQQKSSYLHRDGYVIPGVCLSLRLSVCLCVCRQLHFPDPDCRDMRLSVNNEELIKFRTSFASGSGPMMNFAKDSSRLRDRVSFPRSDSDLRRNFITDVPSGHKKVPTKCRTGFALEETVCASQCYCI